MKLTEVLTVIDSAIQLEIANKKETYSSKLTIPEERMNYIVKSIKPLNNSILIALDETQKVKTLDELGYSFEAGM